MKHFTYYFLIINFLQVKVEAATIDVLEDQPVTVLCRQSPQSERCIDYLKLYDNNKHFLADYFAYTDGTKTVIDKNKSPDWIITTSGHLAGQCNKGDLMRIELNIDMSKLQDSGVFTCIIHFDVGEPETIETNVIIRRKEKNLSFKIWHLEYISSMTVYICSQFGNLNISFRSIFRMNADDLSKSLDTTHTESNEELYAMKCLKKKFFIIFHGMRIEYIEVDTTDLVTMIVVYNWLSYQEAYMALPINEWRSRYIIIYSRAGFVTIISAKNNSSLNVISQEVGEEQLAITEREVELRSCQMILPMMGFVETNTFLGLYVYSDSAFGVVAGQCYLDKQSSVQNLESVLPIEDLPRYTYVAFCPEKRQCYLIVYAMVPGNFTCKKLFGDSHPCWPIKSHANIIVYQNSSNAFLIEGISPMHVVVSMTTVQTGIITLCTIIPSNIFGITYSFMLPDGFSSHYLVLVTQKPYDDLRGHVIQLLKPAFNSSENSAGINIFVGPVTNEDTITSISQTPFGCYLFGDSINNSYATPIHSRFYFNNYVTTSTTTTTTTPTNTSWCIPSLKLPGDNKDNDCDGYVDEEIDNSKDDDNDNKIDEDTAAYTETGCLPGWFGTKCDKLCHCNNSQCLMNGNCKENVTCLPGFFGLQCQYKDVIMSAEVNRQEMKFRHFVKCFNNFTVKDPLNIIFPSSERISSIQIEAVSKDDLLDLQLYFLQIPNISCFVGPCLNRRDIYVDRNTLIVMCNISSNICMVSISFKGLPKPRRLCAVYVNAGRNVAPGSQVTMSSYYNDTFGRVSRGSLSVDGESLSCSTSAVNDSNPVWKMSFLNAMRIDEILINFGDTSPEETFILKFYDDKGNTINKWTGRAGKMVSVIIRNRFAVFSIEAVLSQGVLSICEVETYGECAPPTYGPDCSDICSISCPDMMCTYEGYCRVCPNGTGGPYCFEGCIDWCGDYQDLTNTTTTALISRVTKNPYHTHSGFDLENFWYYLMVILLLVVVVCLSGLDISKGEKKDKAIQEITEQRRESSETAVDITAKPEHLTRSNTSIASMSETPIQ